MKICHVTNQLPHYHKQWGGAEQACYRIVKLLVEKKIENVVLALKPIKEPKEDFEFYAIPVMQDYLGKKIGNLLKRPYDLVSYLYIYNLLRKIKPDIVHLHNFGNIGFGAILAAKKLRIPIVFSVYDYWCFCPLQTLAHKKGYFCTKFHGSQCIECLENKNDPLQKIFINTRKGLFDKLFFRNIDKFIALSNFVARLLHEYGIEKSRTEVIPLPFKSEITSSNKIDYDSIVFIGWIVPRKGLHILLEAMPIIIKKFPKTKLHVLGKEDPYEKDYKRKIEEMAKEKRLEKNISIFRNITVEKSSIAKKAFILVVPEQWQNMSPLIITEGMLISKAIVASNLGGIPELIENRKTGLLAKADSPEDFANKITWLLEHKNEAVKMGREARKRALKMFDEKVIAKKLIRMYKAIIKQKD